MHQIMHMIEVLAFLVLGVSISGSANNYGRSKTLVAVFSLSMFAYSTWLDRPIFLLIVILFISICCFEGWMVRKFGKKTKSTYSDKGHFPSNFSSWINIRASRKLPLLGGALLGWVCSVIFVWAGIERPEKWLLNFIFFTRPGHANFYLLPPIIVCALYGLWVFARLLWGNYLYMETRQTLRWVTLGSVAGIYGTPLILSELLAFLSFFGRELVPLLHVGESIESISILILAIILIILPAIIVHIICYYNCESK